MAAPLSHDLRRRLVRAVETGSCYGRELGWNRVDQEQCEFCHDLGLHVAMLELPLIVSLEQHSTDEPDGTAFV